MERMTAAMEQLTAVMEQRAVWDRRVEFLLEQILNEAGTPEVHSLDRFSGGGSTSLENIKSCAPR